MIWIRMFLRTVLASKLKSLCVVATVILSVLMFLALAVSSSLLAQSSSRADSPILVVAGRSAPFVNPLPARLQSRLERIAPGAMIAPLAVSAVTLGGDALPTALIGTDIDRYVAMNELEVEGEAQAPGRRSRVLIGRSFAERRGISVGDMIRLKFAKSFLPLRTDSLNVRVDGYYADRNTRTGERQILMELVGLEDQALLAPGLVSAFLVRPAGDDDTAALAARIDEAQKSSPDPTITGDQSVVTSHLVSRFADIQGALVYIGILAGIVFLTVLVVASREILVRDSPIYHILINLGFSRRYCGSLSLLKWFMLVLGGLIFTGAQLIVFFLVFGSRIVNVPPELLPTLGTVVQCVTLTLVIALAAFIVSASGIWVGSNPTTKHRLCP